MPRAQDADRPTWVYIIASGDYTKIGVSIDPTKRLRSMGSGIAVNPILYYAREFRDNVTAFAVEKMMHRKYWRLRENGEWFSVSPKTARHALAHIKPPSQEHLKSKGGKGWKDPTPEEIRAAIKSAFSHLGSEPKLDL